MGKNRGCPKWMVLIFCTLLDFSFSGGAIEAADCIQPQDDEIIANLDLFAWRNSVQPGQ